MWHTEEISKVLFEVIDEYGYEVFQDRKLCVALCGDLLAQYEREKNIFQMLFQAGLGNVMSGVPFHTEQEMLRGLQKIVKFLENQAIDSAAQEKVIKIIKRTFCDEEFNSSENFFQPIKMKNYHELHFKLSIPVIKKFADETEFSLKFMYRDRGECIDTIFEKCIFVDKLNNSYSSNKGHILLPHSKNRTVSTRIQHARKKLFFSDARIDFTFLCSNNSKIVVSYSSDVSCTMHLSEIRVYKMTLDEQDKINDIIDLIRKEGEEQEREFKEQMNGALVQPAKRANFEPSKMTDYIDALRREIYFLKSGRGKKYRIVNGTRIDFQNGVYTYLFELETELYLPEDAPVIVDTVEGHHAVGSVLVCEDFQIMLLLDRDVQLYVKSAHLMVEPRKLLEALVERLINLNPNKHQIAMKLINQGPCLSAADDINNVPKGQNEVLKKINENDIVTVWGPPGTGKTYTMALLAKRFLSQGKTVLIVSHSNVSVDGVIKKIVNSLPDELQSLLTDGKILRYGYVRDRQLSANAYATSFNYTLGSCVTYAAQLDEWLKKRDKLKASKKEKTTEYGEVQKKISNIRAKIKKEEKKYVEHASLIGTTISKATVDPLIAERQFDFVMFDEVSMAYIPQVIAAATLARKKFMCVGDFMQLSPISQSSAAKLLQNDIFSYLKIIDKEGNLHMHPWLVMLNEQYRMHPVISEFPNRFVYKGMLVDNAQTERNNQKTVKSEPLSGDALHLIDLTGTYCAAEKNADGSRFNILSAVITFCTAVKANDKQSMTVGIITPYAAQMRLIRAMLKDYFGKEGSDITCATVHQFQGSESDAIVFDAVESYPKSAVGFLMGKDLGNVTRLINVAITRAKGKLIVVANGTFWHNIFKGSNHILYRLLEHIHKKHHVVSQLDKTLLPYVTSVGTDRMLEIYTNERNAINEFVQDCGNAKQCIWVSLPSGELRETHSTVFAALDDADSRGVEVLMKTNDFSNLPDKWRGYCKETQNATFPLIIIDDEVAWYGLPTAKWKFKTSKNSAVVTVAHVMIRFRGRNTVEMLKSLSNIDILSIDGTDASGSDGNKGRHRIITPLASVSQLSQGGLADFVEQKEYCPECKNHMMLTRGRKGKAYLKCSNSKCNHMKYLEPDLMNWYIEKYNITCPKHKNAEIRGILGQYGPCIRCEYGHFMKPEEI